MSGLGAPRAWADEDARAKPAEAGRNGEPAPAASASAGEIDINARAAQVAQSLVAIEYTAGNQDGTQQGDGQGILISKSGVILISGSLISGNPSQGMAQGNQGAPARQGLRRGLRQIPRPHARPSLRFHQAR